MEDLERNMLDQIKELMSANATFKEEQETKMNELKKMCDDIFSEVSTVMPKLMQCEDNS